MKWRLKRSGNRKRTNRPKNLYSSPDSSASPKKSETTDTAEWSQEQTIVASEEDTSPIKRKQDVVLAVEPNLEITDLGECSEREGITAFEEKKTSPIERKENVMPVDKPEENIIEQNELATKPEGNIPADKPIEDIPAIKPDGNILADKPIEDIPAIKPEGNISADKPEEDIPVVRAEEDVLTVFPNHTWTVKSEKDTLKRVDDILSSKSMPVQINPAPQISGFDRGEEMRHDSNPTEAPKDAPTKELIVKESEERHESVEENHIESTYSERYRKKMYLQLLESIDTQVSTSTNDLFDEYLNKFATRDSGFSSYHSSSDDSNQDGLGHCVFIDNYIKDTFKVSTISLQQKREDSQHGEGRNQSRTIPTIPGRVTAGKKSTEHMNTLQTAETI